MKLKLICDLRGAPLELEIDGVAQVVVGESARTVTSELGSRVVFELEATPAPVEPEQPATLPPPPP